ncbi:MAG: retroviral-like aspartic protease family protein [Methanosarcinales archaeon]
MGRIYRPVELFNENESIPAVAILDTGADETVISERIAEKLNLEKEGRFEAICASRNIITGYWYNINY